MQTDLQVLLAITGAVCGFYFIGSMIKRRSKANKEQAEALDDFDTMSPYQSQSDPLMEPNAQQADTFSETDTKLDENAFVLGKRKKVIVDDAVAEIPVKDEVSQINERDTHAPSDPHDNEFIALTVMARHHQAFSGQLLFNAMKANHLYYDASGVFQRHINDNPMQGPMYTVLSMVEPGLFDLERLSEQSFPGIVLLMTLPTKQNPLTIFEKMLNTARQLAVTLDGELCDAKRQPLSAQMMSRLRERVQKMHRRHLSQTSVSSPL